MAYDDTKKDMKFAGKEVKDAAEAGAEGVKDAGRETKDELEEFAKEDK